MAAVTHKRPAPMGDCCPAVSGKTKRARYDYDLGSIYNYKNLETLGEGTYGTVVKAQDERTGETVAVKWIRPDDEGVTDLGAVFREAACLEACRGDPSIVQMKEVASDEVTGHVFIVTEFVGPSLERHLPRRFSGAETRAIMRQLLRGAEKLHGAGMIHRDIKPDNVLVGPGGALKICDLGMAARTRPAGGEPYPEETVAALWYRAPELMRGSRSRRTYGTAVDMWALGCMMIELLIGEPLFKDAETEDDVLHRARDLQYQMESMTDLASDSEFLPELSKAGREVLQGLLSLVPEKRLTAADALSHRWFEEEDAPLSPVLRSQKDQRGFISFL
ncbi:putative cyclin-dependent kinase F-2 [Miscanthus floridulus]|uniref:putative cyclin-dependent kinase F-2 n=1 Tax=Miscanthus floridulus TaxID=154761 RepID=UPI00345A056F